MAKKIIIAYIPVVHQGYYRLFATNPTFRTLYILGRTVTQAYRPLQKEIRALEPHIAKQLLQGLSLLDEVRVIEKDKLAKLTAGAAKILMPDEDVSHDVAKQFLAGHTIHYSPLFLRWDRRRAEAQDAISSGVPLTVEQLHKTMMRKASSIAHRSSNIWRRVGAVLVKDDIIITASNSHRPSQHSPWIDGDVRAQFGRGVGIEMSTDQHAESCVIAEAARRGVALEGADLYVTTFPCPPCSMLVAYSGIKRLFFAQGYAVLDGKRVLEARGIAITRVDVPFDDNADAYVPYPA